MYVLPKLTVSLTITSPAPWANHRFKHCGLLQRESLATIGEFSAVAVPARLGLDAVIEGNCGVTRNCHWKSAGDRGGARTRSGDAWLQSPFGPTLHYQGAALISWSTPRGAGSDAL